MALYFLTLSHLWHKESDVHYPLKLTKSAQQNEFHSYFSLYERSSGQACVTKRKSHFVSLEDCEEQQCCVCVKPMWFYQTRLSITLSSFSSLDPRHSVVIFFATLCSKMFFSTQFISPEEVLVNDCWEVVSHQQSLLGDWGWCFFTFQMLTHTWVRTSMKFNLISHLTLPPKCVHVHYIFNCIFYIENVTNLPK